jgi:hypothetical protein
MVHVALSMGVSHGHNCFQADPTITDRNGTPPDAMAAPPAHASWPKYCCVILEGGDGGSGDNGQCVIKPDVVFVFVCSKHHQP